MSIRLSLFSCTANGAARRALTSAAVALLAITGACGDPLSPEMERRLIETMLDPVADSFPEDFGGIGVYPVAFLQLLPHREIMVEMDGDWARFRAVVLELAMIPDTGHVGRMSRSRRSLVAWRVDDPRERFVMVGRRFPGPMGPWRLDDDPPGMFLYRPSVMMRWSDGRAWISSTGEAAFERLTIGEGCPWPADHLEALQSRLASDGCETVEYKVAFSANLVDRWGKHSNRSTLRMHSHAVPGVRLTLQCGASPDNEGLCLQ